MSKFLDASNAKLEDLGKVAILGYGNQGRAQALNIRDSGVDIVIGQRQGASYDRATQEGFTVLSVAEATEQAQTLMITLPDESMAVTYDKDMRPHLRPEQTLLFSHGFNIHYRLIQPPSECGVGLVSPKGQAAGVRGRYLEGSGVPALIDYQYGNHPSVESVCLAYAKAVGYSRTILLKTSFKEETETDLFGEQVVLCGGVIELVKMAYDVLVSEGYSKEGAYFECYHELKLIVDLMNVKGLEQMRAGISDTAEWGGYQVGPKLITDQTRDEIVKTLRMIQDGSFAKGWVEEAMSGKKNLLRLRQEESTLSIEEIGNELRPLIN